ncbi:MAG TPA: nucleotide exchange factor GrpE [Chloroflexota bacterium]|nr:nucleotide exchange factor GrpE [Chloroflexota bacterium]
MPEETQPAAPTPPEDAATEGAPTEGTTEASASAEASEIAQLRKELEEARSRCQTYLDLAQRTQADFVNYRRRIEQERNDFIRSARAEAILKILPALDDLERAVQAIPPEIAGSEWVQGIVLIERKIRTALEAEGVKRIEAVGKPFDPWTEEAVVHEPSTEYAPGIVSRVYRTGYSLDGRVIRPALVVVSSGPPDGSSPPPEGGTNSTAEASESGASGSKETDS